MRTVGSGLRFPEGPVWLGDDGLLVVEIAAGRISAVRDGLVTTVAQCGGGPNSAAIGPDGALYICNNGGLQFADVSSRGWLIPGDRAVDNLGGCIQRVDMQTGNVTVLYAEGLRAPCDLVFDRRAGFWFTDHGHSRGEERDWGSIWWALPDGSELRKVVPGMDTPNGIGLSPDGTVLYVAETGTARLWAWTVTGPGELVDEPRHPRSGGRLVVGLGGYHLFDSLAVEADGSICVATMGDRSGISVISPDGTVLDFVELDDPAVTNLCFGGPALRTAFVTCSATGRLEAVDWPRPGLTLAHGPS